MTSLVTVTQIILTLDKIFQRVVPNEIKSDLTVRKDVGECKEYPVKIKVSTKNSGAHALYSLLCFNHTNETRTNSMVQGIP